MRYLHGVGIPSLFSGISGNRFTISEAGKSFYYSKPWERMADIFGEVDWNQSYSWANNRYLYGSLPISVLYQEWLRRSTIGMTLNGKLYVRGLNEIFPEISRWFNRPVPKPCWSDIIRRGDGE